MLAVLFYCENMSKRFSRDWEGNRSFLPKINLRKTPLRDMVLQALYKLNLQREKLAHMATKMEHHDKNLFEKCVEATLNKDTYRANIYAMECAEVRKISKAILLAQLALERVILRLETVKEFGDIAVAVAPAATVVSTLKDKLSGILPEVSYELGNISESLHSMVIEAGEISGVSVEPSLVSNEAEKILEEASFIAEQRLKEKFPELPAASSLDEKSSEDMK